MKKQLIKEILDINKLLKNELKTKNEINANINNLEQEIKQIEDKIKLLIKDKKEYDKIPTFSELNKLYQISEKKYKEKTFIENNYHEFKKQNEIKENELHKYYKELFEKKIKNDELIRKKINDLTEEYEKIQRRYPEDQKQEQYIISPENMSIHMVSKIANEIDFMNVLKKKTESIKFKNNKILKDIDLYYKKYNNLKSKKESSANELSTTAKNSSHLEKKNYIFQQLENSRNKDNININNINNDNQESSSSISMEIETNLNLEHIPSDDESLRFIDKVFDIKSNIKPIKNKIKAQFFPPSASVPMEKTKKAEPIKISRPIDYKAKKDNITKNIDIIQKEIKEKIAKIEESKEKRKIIEEENKKKEENLKHALMKIKIIQEKINVIRAQIEDFKENKENGEYFRLYSIRNIINNRNYYLYNINNENNFSDLGTLRK